MNVHFCETDVLYKLYEEAIFHNHYFSDHVLMI